MRVSAKSDYALRALIEMAGAHRREGGQRRGAGQGAGDPARLPPGDPRRPAPAGIVVSQRGQSGGWRLARARRSVSVADVIRAVDGPLVSVYGLRPEAVELQRHRRRAPARVDRRPPLAARRLRAGLDPAARRRQAAGGGHLTHRRRGRLAAALTRRVRRAGSGRASDVAGSPWRAGGRGGLLLHQRDPRHLRGQLVVAEPGAQHARCARPSPVTVQARRRVGAPTRRPGTTRKSGEAVQRQCRPSVVGANHSGMLTKQSVRTCGHVGTLGPSRPRRPGAGDRRPGARAGSRPARARGGRRPTAGVRTSPTARASAIDHTSRASGPRWRMNSLFARARASTTHPTPRERGARAVGPRRSTTRRSGSLAPDHGPGA